MIHSFLTHLKKDKYPPFLSLFPEVRYSIQRFCSNSRIEITIESVRGHINLCIIMLAMQGVLIIPNLPDNILDASQSKEEEAVVQEMFEFQSGDDDCFTPDFPLDSPKNKNEAPVRTKVKMPEVKRKESCDPEIEMLVDSEECISEFHKQFSGDKTKNVIHNDSLIFSIS